MKTKIASLSVLTILTLLVSGCASPKIASTESGRPEVFINTKNTDAIKSAIISWATTAGYKIENDSPYRLSFTGSTTDMEAVATKMAIGNSYSSQPVKTLGFTFANINDGVRVVADGAVSTQMAFGQVNQMDISRGSRWFNDIQSMLEMVKFNVERNGPPRARLGLQSVDPSTCIVKVVGPNTAAEKAGITKGCQILHLNGKPYSQTSIESEIRSKNPGNKVTVVWTTPSGTKVTKEIALEAPPPGK